MNYYFGCISVACSLDVKLGATILDKDQDFYTFEFYLGPGE